MIVDAEHFAEQILPVLHCLGVCLPPVACFILDGGN